jgi:hypothetical protein
MFFMTMGRNLFGIPINKIWLNLMLMNVNELRNLLMALLSCHIYVRHLIGKFEAKPWTSLV